MPREAHWREAVAAAVFALGFIGGVAVLATSGFDGLVLAAIIVAGGFLLSGLVDARPGSRNTDMPD